MRFNVFEGARRIAMLLGALWVIGWLAHAIFSEPYAALKLEVPGLGSTPVVMAGDCPPTAAREYIVSVPGADSHISVDLCFTPSPAIDGSMLVPYAPTEDGGVWMGTPYATEVTGYTARYAESFRLDAANLAAADEVMGAARTEQWVEAMQMLAGGLIGGWIFVYIIGWIVRGFLGIPGGQDHKQTTPGK